MGPVNPSCFDCFPLTAQSLPRFYLFLRLCFSFSDSLPVFFA